ncbi:MAG: FecR family protein [Caulobacteraceae bacterium]
MPAPEREKLAKDAARWFARSRAPQFSGADRQALQAWLDQSEAHRAAYLEVIDLWNAISPARSAPEVLSMREMALRRYPAASRRQWPLLAAAVTLAVGLGAILTMLVADLTKAAPSQTFRTAIGQTATVALIDGSRLTLDTDTVLHVRIGRRRREIVLDQGRAFFKVAKDRSRPFVVTVQAKSVTATGTAFEVTAGAKRFEVLLVEGHVRVSQPAAGKPGQMTTDLDPGARLIASADGGWTLTRSDGDRDLAWMQGELLFNNKPLGEIAAEMNRYSRRKIVIADPHVASRTVYGAFMAGDVDQFVRALVDYKIARIQSDGENTVVLTGP